MRGTVFWRVAAVMIAVQIATAVLAAGFAIWYASDAQRSLATVAIAARLDAVGEEIERRATDFGIELNGFSDELQLDLTYRFPDPIVLLDLSGRSSVPFLPATDAFGGLLGVVDSVAVVPAFLSSDNVLDDVYVDYTDDFAPGGFAAAPLFDETGFPVGVVLVQPIRNSMALELSDSKAAFRRSIRIIAGLSILVALLLGAFFTWWLVRPLRQMAGRVQRIGQGAYDERLEVVGHDEFASLAGAINDMTEQVEQSIWVLRESDRVRRELITNVGHDLRTPLSAIRAHIEESLRFRGEGREVDAQNSLVSAERQTVYLGQLVGDLFELGVLESERPRLKKEPVLPAELIFDAISGQSVAAREAGLSLRSKVSPEVPVFEADGTRLLRLMNNLISNSIRHTASGGYIDVRASMEDGSLVVSIEDNGEGVSEEDLARLFDRYYRGVDSRTRSKDSSRPKGTGLGLAISRAIAEAHGGTLTASSTAGEGMTMMLRMPVRNLDA